MSTAPICTSCDIQMVLRKPNPNSSTQFSPFFGCPNYPDCQVTFADNEYTDTFL